MIASSLYKSFFFCSHSAVFWSNSACCLASWSLCSLSSRRVCSWACLSFSALSLSAMSSYSCSGFLSSVPFFSSLSIFAYMVDMTSSSHLAKWVCRVCRSFSSFALFISSVTSSSLPKLYVLTAFPSQIS